MTSLVLTAVGAALVVLGVVGTPARLQGTSSETSAAGIGRTRRRAPRGGHGRSGRSDDGRSLNLVGPGARSPSLCSANAQRPGLAPTTWNSASSCGSRRSDHLGPSLFGERFAVDVGREVPAAQPLVVEGAPGAVVNESSKESRPSGERGTAPPVVPSQVMNLTL